jgi:hypothetical protein
MLVALVLPYQGNRVRITLNVDPDTKPRFVAKTLVARYGVPAYFEEQLALVLEEQRRRVEQASEIAEAHAGLSIPVGCF